MKNSYLTDVLFRLEQVSRDVHDVFFNLNEEQIMWKEAEMKWSIGQCLEHLIRTDTAYFSQVQSVLAGRYNRPRLSYIPFLGKIWGRLALKAVDSKVRTPLSSPDMFYPNEEFNPSHIVHDYEVHVANLTQLIRDTDHFNHKRIFFKSPMFKGIVYPLSDTLKLMANHHERHLNQAMNVYNALHFPKMGLNDD